MTPAPLLRFDGRSAVVTGAGRGLGRAYALLLAERGTQVVVNDHDAPAAKQVAAEIVAAGGEAVADTSTVATPAGGKALAATAGEAFGTPDVVVNNAGVARAAAFSDLSPELFSELVATHLLGPYHVLSPLWPTMLERGYGRVVNVSSGAVWGMAGEAAYAACKAAVMGLTRVLAREGRHRGVQVNCVLPWAVTRNSPDRSDTEHGPVIAAHMRPEKVAPAVVWLAHEECPVSGEFFTVDGGRMARLAWVAGPGATEENPAMESYRDRWEEVMNLDGYVVPFSTADHVRRAVMPHFGAG